MIFLVGWVSELLERQNDFRTSRPSFSFIKICKVRPFLGMLLCCQRNKRQRHIRFLKIGELYQSVLKR